MHLVDYSRTLSRAERPSRLRAFAAVAVAALLTAAGCSHSKEESKKEEPAATATVSQLTKYLPGNTAVFYLADTRVPGFAEYLRSGAYQRYMQSIQEQLSKNPAQTGDFTTYFEVLRKIGMLGGDPAKPFPYASMMFYAVPGTAPGLSFASYLDAGEVDPRETMKSLRAALQQRSVKATESSGPGYEAIEVTLFRPDETLPPGLALYRDSLHLTNAFFGANKDRFVIATTKELLERGFGEPKNEYQTVLDGKDFKDTLAALPKQDAEVGYGLLDLPAVIRTVLSGKPVPPMPLSLLAFRYSAEGKGMAGHAAMRIVPQDDQQRAFVKIFESGAGSSSALQRVPAASVLSVSFDGGVLRNSIEMAAKQAPVPPQAAPLMQLLPSVKTIQLGVVKASTPRMMPIPDLTLAIESSDAAKLVDQIRALLSGPGMLPPGMLLQESTENGQKLYSLPTPVGLSVFLGVSGDSMVLTTDKSAFAAGGLKGSSAVPAKLLAGLDHPALAMLIDYGSLAELAKTTMLGVPGGMPPGMDVSAFDNMKQIGVVGIAFEVRDGMAKMSMTQNFPASPQ